MISLWAGWDEQDDARQQCEDWGQPELFYCYMMCQQYEGMTEVLCRQVSAEASLESGTEPAEWSDEKKGSRGMSAKELAQLKEIMAPIAASLNAAAPTCPPHVYMPYTGHDCVFYCQHCLETKRLELPNP